jgi:Zn-finger nucleic acid-binding protein
MTERKGIEIDFCPDCRGVWLDRGELDKILEKSIAEVQEHYRPQASQQAMQPTPSDFPEMQQHEYYDSHNYKHGKQNHGQYGHRKSRKPWFMELFD